METIIRELYERIYNDSGTKKPTVFVELVDKYSGFELWDIPQNQEFRRMYTRLLGDYGIMLYEVERYGSSIFSLSRAMTLLETDISVQDVWQEELYKSILTFRCCAFSRIGNQDAAVNDACLLVKHYPDESYYLELLQRSEHEKRKKSNKKKIKFGIAIVLLVGSGIIILSPVHSYIHYLGYVLIGLLCLCLRKN